VNKPTLDTILENPRRKRGSGCPVCGKHNVAYLQVRLAELDDDGKFKTGCRSASRSRSFCADHAPEMWTALTETLDR
jgi:hypothetical protein